MYRGVLSLLLFAVLPLAGNLWGQVIKGAVADIKSRNGLSDVSITNVHTAVTITTSADGRFEIPADRDQLLEFRKQNYKTVRVRIPARYVPPYFMIIMELGINPIKKDGASDNRYDYSKDSQDFYSLYKHELEFARLNTLQSIAHPFSALSKRNREIWRFQEEYSDFEKDKYVDNTFNGPLITRFTGLSGDSLRHYLIRYRPTYLQLRNMNDYSFYSYIKRTVQTYRSGSEHRRSAE